MIKFFRHIRQKLLTENNFSKYLFYAIGEIVLVVIGILIALSINTWNEKRVNNKKTIAYLSEMIEDLKSDTLIFSTVKESYDKEQLLKEQFLRKKDFSKERIDDLVEITSSRTYPFQINDNTYQKLKNSGISNLTNMTDLSNMINQYYVRDQRLLSEISAWDLEASGKESEDFLYGQNTFENRWPKEIPVFQNEKENKEQFIALITSIKGRNIQKEQYRRKQWVIKTIDKMHKNAKNLISEIQKNIK